MLGLAARLASTADQAYAIRRLDIVGQVGELLLRLPLSGQLESVGRYYLALALNKGGGGDTARAGSLFEEIADSASLAYRARAMLALGGNSLAVGDNQTAISFYQEVMRLGPRDRVLDPVTFCVASRMTAVVKAIEGNHRGAVADLEMAFPLVRMASSVQPYAYYEHLNTLAVELGEVGRLEQARRASEIALASPFACGYPEWRETFDEIAFKLRRASRSIVAVRQYQAEPCNARPQAGGTNSLLRMPAPEHAASTEIEAHSTGTKARVLDFQKWKSMTSQTSSPPAPVDLTPDQRNRMTTGEKLIRLMDLISRDETDDEMIDRILEAVEGIVQNGATTA